MLEQAARENGWGTEEGEAYLPLVDPTTDPPASCLAGSYFTQTRLVVDATCPSGTVLNVAALAPLDARSQRTETSDAVVWAGDRLSAR